MVRLRLFGVARDAAGERESRFDGATVEDVLKSACDRYGDEFVKVLKESKVWLNGEPAGPHQPVTGADEVAVLPPFSGG